MLHILASEFAQADGFRRVNHLFYARKGDLEAMPPNEESISNVVFARDLVQDKKKRHSDESSPHGSETEAIYHRSATLHWRNLCYNIKTKSGTRRILNNIDGWVKPGTMTALMVCQKKIHSTT